MRTLIVDSNVISYIYKQDTRAALYEPHLANALTFTSFMTLAELERWAIAQIGECASTPAYFTLFRNDSR